MPGMLELPQLALRTEAEDSKLVLSEEPMLRVRHAIVGTNYYVEVLGLRSRREVTRRVLRREDFEWVATRDLVNAPADRPGAQGAAAPAADESSGRGTHSGDASADRARRPGGYGWEGLIGLPPVCFQ